MQVLSQFAALSGGNVVKRRNLVKTRDLSTLIAMLEKSRRRLLVGGLVIVAAVTFGTGINWGLPSHAIDPILFGAGGDSAATGIDSFHLTGVGINRLAGDWQENSGLAADVAAHPIADRSNPVTLLDNRHEITEAQLIQQGDSALTELSAKADAADKRYAILRMGSDDKAATAAQEKALAAQLKVHQYVEDYNRKNFPDLKSVKAADDVSRARILRRYRLYSYQPDEMISFRALAMMHPGKYEFDPKLYQYGGLWIYPLGAIIKASSLLGFATVNGDSTFYLDSPEVFGRFYILGRAYSAAWGIVAALAVFAILRRAAGGLLIPFLGALCFICLPVVVDLAHEAKPHLAGTAILLLAILSAGKYIETGKGKWIVWTAIACGACAGMVLSGAVALTILPVMAIVRRDRPGRLLTVLVGGVFISAAVYFAANPYVAIHLIGDSGALRANLANTRAMYSIGDFGSSVTSAIRLVLAGTSWPVAVAGCAAIAVMIVKRDSNARGIGWLIGLPAMVIFIQFALFAASKPGEYGRFASFVDTGLMLLAFIGIARSIRSRPMRMIMAIALVAGPIVYSAAYESGFIGDSGSSNSRIQASATIEAKLQNSPVLYLAAEPAPYCLPPVNLFRWRMVLLPMDGSVPAGSAAGVLVRPNQAVDVLDPVKTPLSWANMQFDVADAGGK